MTTASVLVVDDEPDVRETVAALLSPDGYELRFATNGHEALAAARGAPPDLVLLDVMMPHLDGFETCRRLRADPVLTDVPVVLVTVLDDRESRLKGFDAGADDFVSKPFDRLELRARVRTIVRLNRYRRLLSERERFAWVVEASHFGYLTLDDTGHVTYANTTARHLLGLPPAAPLPLGESFLARVQRLYRLEPAPAWREWTPTAANGVRRYLVRPETTEAEALWLSVQVLPSPVAGGECVVRLHDVTASVLIHRSLRSFRAFVAHKLHTPLHQVLAAVEVVRDFVPPDSDANEWVDIATTSSARLRAAVDDVLSYTDEVQHPGEGAGLGLDDLAPLVAEVATTQGVTRLVTHVPPELATSRLRFSPRAMFVVLNELLENSKKFHPANDPLVTIDVERVSASAVRVRVADDGRPLSPEKIRDVWTPSFQGEKYFTGEQPGMGLGLPQVAMLVWNVGGTCDFSNRPDGPGVVIDLVLPTLDSQP